MQIVDTFKNRVLILQNKKGKRKEWQTELVLWCSLISRSEQLGEDE